MNNNNNNNNNGKKRGVDALLTQKGKSLAPGNSISFRLIKGPPSNNTATADPVDKTAPKQHFPLVAKFPETSVVRPDFTTSPWNQGRLYQQDVPKPLEDSDEEEETTHDSEQQQQQQKKKKRWKYNQNSVPKRQWILQEQVDFLETMVARREKKKQLDKKLSSRYEGMPEHNNSHYVLFMTTSSSSSSLSNITTTAAANPEQSQQQQESTIQVRLLPHPSKASTTVTFAQPAARQTLSLSQAEQVIQDQRMPASAMKLLMMMNNNNNNNNASSGAGANNGPAATTSSTSTTGPQPQPRHLLKPPGTTNKAAAAAAAPSRNRLLNKLEAKEKSQDIAEEADDVMGDVAFRNRRKGGGGGGGGAARRELLLSLGDGIAVSDEGVLGGTNDTVFGGKQRFGQFRASEQDGKTIQAQDNSLEKERGADGAAMEEDFYQRDVKAEYEELDYDANEQFEDDDVDMGESEVVVDSSGGYGEEDNEEELEELDVDEEAVSGAEGLATVAGFKAMLAKARGESPVQPEAAAEAAVAAGSKKDDATKLPVSPKQVTEPEAAGDHIAKVMKAAEKSRQAAQEKLSQQQQQQAKKPAAAAHEPAIQVDENGLRIITLEAVRREIWLNHGSIPMKRLMKIFDVKKKSAKERQNRFREVVKELCTMKNDPVSGRMLVLKQHYSNM